MGVDLRVITGHRLSAAEVLDFGTYDPVLKEFSFYTHRKILNGPE